MNTSEPQWNKWLFIVGHWAHPFHLIHLTHRDDIEEFWEVFFFLFPQPFWNVYTL
jgi:hypothetical protein